MKCAYCQSMIVMGGVRDGSRRFCNIGCAAGAVRAEVAQLGSDELTRQRFVSERLSSLPGRSPAPRAMVGAVGLLFCGIAVFLFFEPDVPLRILTAVACLICGAAMVAKAALDYLPKQGGTAKAVQTINEWMFNPSQIGSLLMRLAVPIFILEGLRPDGLNFGWPVFLLLLAVGFLALHIMLVVHEAGHLIAAKLVGIKVRRFVAGSGPGGEWQIGGITFVFGVRPSYGFVAPESNAALLSPWKRGIFFAGGYIAQTAVALLAFWGLQWLWPLRTDIILYALLNLGVTIVLFSAQRLLYGLVPRLVPIEGRLMPNDGMLLWNLWKNRRKMGEPSERGPLERSAKKDSPIKVRYSLGLEDHLAWYDYYYTTLYGQHEKSNLPLIGKYLDRISRKRFGRTISAKNNQTALGERSLELRAEGVREFSSSYDFTSAWSEIAVVAATASHLFIAHTSMNSHIVPLNAFGSDDERAAFIRCAEARGALQEKTPNQAPLPTPMSVTAVTDAPVAPATGAAEL